MNALPEVCKTPCNECPWRRKSAPGWLGPHTAEEWIEIAHGEQPIACHLTIESGRWDDDQSLRQCAGAAQFRRNVLKSPRNPEIAVAENPDTEKIFAWNNEFLAHHGGGR